MTTTTIATRPDESHKAQQLIELGLALDPEARSETLARLIAASLHDGPGTAMERFAATGALHRQEVLQQLNDLRVPIEREGWVDALGRFVILSAGEQS